MKLWILLLVLLSGPVAAESAAVASKDGVLVDSSRRREVPYRIHHPEPLEGRYPVIIVSHGLGGSRDNNALLGRELASRGYICVHLQHAGSDEAIYAGAQDRRGRGQAQRAAVLRPLVAIERFRDVPFALRELARLNEQDPTFKEHLDLAAVGMAGHSYGAISTLVAAGLGVGRGSRSFKVDGLRAAVALSPSPPNAEQSAQAAYAGIDIPLFHITGTKDSSPDALDRDIEPADRLQPYQALSVPDQYLLVLDKADHMTFSGARIGTRAEVGLDKQHMTAVVNGAALFFDAYLKGQDERKTALRTEFAKSLGKRDRFEFK